MLRSLVGAIGTLAVTGALVSADDTGAPPKPAPPASAMDSRQVTLFGIVATPDSEQIDPKLLQIAVQLKTLRPGHGFRLRGVTSMRLYPGAKLSRDLGDGIVARAEMVDPRTEGGKVKIRCSLEAPGKPTFSTTVTTPPNQLFFIEKPLGDGEDRLLIGIGAR